MRQFTKIGMPLSQALQHLLKVELISLRDPPQNPNISSPKYNLNMRCAYHSNSPRHDTNNCWALKNKIQNIIDNKEIKFDPPETPNVIITSMPKHDKCVNAIDVVFDEEDADNTLDNWIFPTTDNGLCNWKAEDVVSISLGYE